MMMGQMKLFQHDQILWSGSYDDDHIWQFGIINNCSLLRVQYENPSGLIMSAGCGFHFLVSFFSDVSLFGVGFQVPGRSLNVHLFAEYFEGGEDGKVYND
jgi:hypothetical protein